MLNDRRETFGREMAKGNVSQAEAARRAGYAPRSARQQGSLLMADPDVQDVIRSQRAELLEQAGVKVVTHVKNLDTLALDSETPAGARIKASAHLIDMGAEQQPRDVRHLHVHLTAEQYEAARRLLDGPPAG